MPSLPALNYDAPAELFPGPSRTKRGQFKYKRFATAAEAIRFAIEDIPAVALRGACLEIDEARFGYQEIHCLYDDAAYPLKRCGSDVLPDVLKHALPLR